VCERRDRKRERERRERERERERERGVGLVDVVLIREWAGGSFATYCCFDFPQKKNTSRETVTFELVHEWEKSPQHVCEYEQV
jgi:hypothetical protein